MKTKWLYSYDGDNNDGNINDGDTFAWTSNIQLISKVYLKKHTSMGVHLHPQQEGLQDGE